MAIDNIHVNGGVLVNMTYLPAAGKIGLMLGNKIDGEPTNGEVYRRWVSLNGRECRASFNTFDIASALDVATYPSYKIDDDADPTQPLALYMQAADNLGTRKGASLHRKYAIKEGILAPMRLSAQGQGDAVIDYEAVIVKDGSNNPVVVTDTESLPTAVDDAARFALGGITIGAATITEVSGLDIDFGITLTPLYDGSDLDPTNAYVQQILGTVTLTGVSVLWLKNAAADVGLIGLDGLAATHANTTIYLKKRARYGTFVADNEDEHIAITACGIATVENAFDASGTDPATCTLKLECSYDGTNAPFVIDTTSVIS